MNARADLSVADIGAMLAPILEDRTIREVVRADGGITNTVYRVSCNEGDVFGLRIYAAGGAAVDREARLLKQLADTLPVPRPMLSSTLHRYPHLAYRWIDGYTLNQIRRKYPDALDGIATSLGAVMAKMAATFRRAETSRPRDDVAPIARRLMQADERLRGGLARRRLGDDLADRIRELFGNRNDRLRSLDNESALVHNDFGGRNIIVRQNDEGAWEVSGVIDWESSSLSSPMWDMGSLFRYARRYGPSFRDAFSAGHRAAGGSLPDDWWFIARMLDATLLIDICADDREQPEVYADCKSLLASLVDEAENQSPAGVTDDRTHLRSMIDLAAIAKRRGDPPFAARIVDADGFTLSEAANLAISTGDPLAHAEMIALRAIANRISASELASATLYTSAEPCAMCAGAIAWSGIGRVAYALDAAQVRALDGDARTEPGITGRELLERSGRVAEHVALLAPEAAAKLWPDATLPVDLPDETQAASGGIA